MATKKRRRLTFEKSSGNVFADIGFANPEREQLKAHLTLQLYRIIKSRGLTQVEAGAILGIKQPHVSALMRNRSGNFSVERVMDFSIALGQDVEITVRPTRKEHGQVRLSLLDFSGSSGWHGSSTVNVKSKVATPFPKLLRRDVPF